MPFREEDDQGEIKTYEYLPRTEENFALLTQGRCPESDAPAEGTTTTTRPPVLQDGLPPVVNRPPDPADAPAADALFAERFAFAARTAYLDNIAHVVALDPNPGADTTVLLLDQASGSERATVGPEGGAATLDTVYVPNATCTGLSMAPQASGKTSYTERSVNDVTTGAMVEDGRETIEGQATIRLRYTGHRTGDFMWLDAETLWPVRTSFQGQEGGEFISHYEFLPRTAENFALLNDGRCA